VMYIFCMSFSELFPFLPGIIETDYDDCEISP